MIPQLTDLRHRLREKAGTLRSMANKETVDHERCRLVGKAQGLDLAVSFIDEIIRDEQVKVVSTRVDL